MRKSAHRIKNRKLAGSLIGGLRGGILATLVIAALVGCPPIIDQELLDQVDDVIAPEIAITSPSNNSYYRSVLTVQGSVGDSSVEEGDGNGSVKTLTYEILDHSQLSGDVDIGGGGSFEFSFTTTGLSGTEILRFAAEDWNGNATEKDITLLEDTSGPYVAITSPSDYDYYRSHVIVQATVANSDEDAGVSEIGSVAWWIPGSALAGTVAAGDWAGGSFQFEFDTTGPPTLVGNRFVIVTAEDQNGHTSEAAITITEYPTGPYIDLTEPIDMTTCQWGTPIVITGTVSDLETGPVTVNEVSTLSYSIGGNTGPIPFNGITGVFSIPFSDTFEFKGTKVLKVIAVDKNNHATEVLRTLLDDETGPYLLVASPPEGATYSYDTIITVAGEVRNIDDFIYVPPDPLPDPDPGAQPLSDVKSLSLTVSGPPAVGETLTTWVGQNGGGTWTGFFSFDIDTSLLPSRMFGSQTLKATASRRKSSTCYRTGWVRKSPLARPR